nr:hypothetical protein [Pandoravirus aubagnensis]
MRLFFWERRLVSSFFGTQEQTRPCPVAISTWCGAAVQCDVINNIQKHVIVVTRVSMRSVETSILLHGISSLFAYIHFFLSPFRNKRETLGMLGDCRPHMTLC